MDPHGEPDTANVLRLRCQAGCGLAVTPEDGERHRCLDALRSMSDELEEKGAALEQRARAAKLKSNRREQNLLAQVAALQSEAQLAALRYQRRLHRYMLHIDGIAELVRGYREVSVVSEAAGARTRVLDCHAMKGIRSVTGERPALAG